MADHTRSSRPKRLSVGLAFGLAILGIAACQPTVPGLSIETGPAETFQPSIRITMQTARQLTVRCSSAGKVQVNGTDLTIACAEADQVLVYGSAGDDTVDLDLREFPNGGCAYLGDGDDTATLRHRGSSATNAIRVGCLWGGAGDDVLDIGFDGSRPYRTFPNDAVSTLQGGPGDDRLTDLGYTRGGQPATGATPADTRLMGGDGTDLLVGAKDRPTSYLTDLDDTVVYGDQPRAVRLDVADNPTVLVHNNGNYGTRVTVDRGTLHREIRYPKVLPQLLVHVGGGNSTVTVDHKSASTAVDVSGESFDDGGGAFFGNDELVLHPRNPHTWDQAGHVLTQPGAQPWTYNGFATVTLDNTWP